MDLQLKEFNTALYKNNLKHVSTEFSKEKGLIINLLEEEAVSDYVDLDFIKSVIKDFEPLGEKKHHLLLPFPVLIQYKGAPLLDIMPNGEKKLHSLAGMHLGLQLLVSKIFSGL